MSNKFRSYNFVWKSSGHKLVGIYQNLVGIYQKLVGIHQIYIPVIIQSDYSVCYSYDLNHTSVFSPAYLMDIDPIHLEYRFFSFDMGMGQGQKL